MGPLEVCDHKLEVRPVSMVQCLHQQLWHRSEVNRAGIKGGVLLVENDGRREI